MRKQRAEIYLVGIKTILDLLLTASNPLWYEKTLKAYFDSKGYKYDSRLQGADAILCPEYFCVRLGIGLKIFDALYLAGIRTISDLLQASPTLPGTET